MENNLARLEEKIRQAPLPETQRDELLKLATSLRAETGPLAGSDPEKAASIVDFAHAAAHEALRRDGDEKSRQEAQEGLLGSVEEFEQTHPRLVQTVSGLCEMLANIGI
jgi:hypothetical protein